MDKQHDNTKSAKGIIISDGYAMEKNGKINIRYITVKNKSIVVQYERSICGEGDWNVGTDQLR